MNNFEMICYEIGTAPAVNNLVEILLNKKFDEVYPGYFNKLIKYSNKLTQNDLRLCAYIRLNQTTKEIAQMCGVSIRTIESQKYRLRKKLKLSKDQSLTTFLFSLDLM